MNVPRKEYVPPTGWTLTRSTGQVLRRGAALDNGDVAAALVESVLAVADELAHKDGSRWTVARIRESAPYLAVVCDDGRVLKPAVSSSHSREWRLVEVTE